MLSETQILLYLHTDDQFSPSKAPNKKIIKDTNGNIIYAAQSYYHNYGNGEQISIRVSNHGTALRTWIKRKVDPTRTIQNLSIVFSNELVSSKLETEPTTYVDSNGEVKTQNLYFVVEQYAYKMDSLSLKDFKKIISKLKHLDDNTVFNDPFKKET